MNTADSLNNVFTEDFIRTNSSIGNIDDLYDKVKAADPGIAREDFDAYVRSISDSMHTGDLSEADLENVSGGIAWEAVAGACALITVCYKGGEALGRGIYYMTHR